MTFGEIKDKLAALEDAVTKLSERQAELVRYILLQVDKTEQAAAKQPTPGIHRLPSPDMDTAEFFGMEPQNIVCNDCNRTFLVSEVDAHVCVPEVLPT